MPVSTSAGVFVAGVIDSETEVSTGLRTIVTPSQGLSLLCRFLDCADIHECLLGQMVPLALEQLLEAAHRVGDWHVLASHTREDFGNEHRLTEEALDAPRALH